MVVTMSEERHRDSIYKWINMPSNPLETECYMETNKPRSNLSAIVEHLLNNPECAIQYVEHTIHNFDYRTKCIPFKCN